MTNMTIDNEVVMDIGGATYYTDGSVICWMFECVCDSRGCCEECEIYTGYWEHINKQ